MCAPSSVVAIDPVGITNASTTNARNTNARIKAIRIDSMVSFTPLPVVIAASAAGGAVGCKGFSAEAAVGGVGVRGSSMVELSYANHTTRESKPEEPLWDKASPPGGADILVFGGAHILVCLAWPSGGILA